MLAHDWLTRDMTTQPKNPNYVLLSITLVLFVASTVSSILTFENSTVAGVLSVLAAIIWLTVAGLELRKIRTNS